MKTLILVLLVLAVVPATTQAALTPDSAAPPGTTDPLWLPDEEWVMERWIPFDEDRLFAALKMDRVAVYWYLKPGHGSLRDLARSRGVSLTAEALLSNRRRQVNRGTYTVLLARTRRMLTQRHLAEHVLGHPWHRWSVLGRLDEIIGDEYAALRAEGVPFEGLAGRVSVPRHVLRDRILGALHEAGRRGVAQGAMSAKQARTIELQDRIQVEAPLSGRVALLCPLQAR